jgi:MFS family permease
MRSRSETNDPERRAIDGGTGRLPPAGLPFALLGAVQVTLIATITVIAVALPAVQRDLRLDGSGLILVATAYGVSFGGLLLLGGRLADVLGHRRAFVTGTAVFGLGSAAAGLAPGLAALLVARFFQGAGAAMAAPAAIALVGSVFPDPARRGRAMALWGVLSSAGATAGNVLSGMVITWVPWRWVFLAPVLVAAVVVLAAGRLLPAGPAPVRARIDWPGAVLATGGLAALIFGAQYSMPVAAAGLLLLGALAVIEYRTPSPLVPLGLARRLLLPLLAVTAIAASMATAFFQLSLYLQQVHGLSPAQTSAVFLLPAPLLIASGAIAGRLVDRIGARRAMVAGLLLAGLGLLLLSLLGLPIAGLLVFSLGAGLTFSSATVAAFSDVSGGEAGLAGGLVNTGMEVGPPLGITLLVSLAAAVTHDVSGRYALGFRFAAVLCLVTALIVALAARRRT